MSVQIFGKGKKVALQRRHARLRKRISGTPERPRLVVTRSNRHMVAQVVDDTKGITLVSASTLQADFAGFEGTKTEAAKKVGELMMDAIRGVETQNVDVDLECERDEDGNWTEADSVADEITNALMS